MNVNDQLSYGRGFHPAAQIFGWLFLTVGVASVVLGQVYHEPIAIALGSGFSVVGLVLALSRYGITIDKRLYTITAWRSLLSLKFHRQTTSLTSFTNVTLTCEHHGGGWDSNRAPYDEYVVSLGGKDTLIRVNAFCNDFPKARAQCEQLAKFLQFPIHDQKEEGKTIVRQVSELNESLAQRARRTGERVNVPPQPAECLTEHYIENGRTVFLIPPSGFELAEILLLGFACVGFIPVLVALVLFIFQPEAINAPRPLCIAVMCMSVIPILLMRFAIISATRSERLTISLQGIHLEYLDRNKKPRTVAVIPASEVEELELCESTQRQQGDRVIAVRSDRMTIEFGGRLKADEQEWLYAILWTTLTVNQEKMNADKQAESNNTIEETSKY